jgi:hypothetical protein
MLILGSGELQIRPNGWCLVYSIPKSALEMLILGADELQIRPKGWWLVYFIPNKRIGNAYALAGRIANSPERGL